VTLSPAIAAVVVGYAWLIGPRAPQWAEGVAAGVVVALSAWRAARTGEWGLAPRAFAPALRWALVATLPALSLILGAGALMGTCHLRPLDWRDPLWLVLWAAGQQFALQTVLLRELEQRVSRRRAVWMAATIFAALHAPNPFLVGLTFVGGAAWCAIYQRHPHIGPLALSHALATLAVLHAFDDRLTGRLRIGWAYLQSLPR
jgi:membrane protease YdiL (CAAX protease family)